VTIRSLAEAEEDPLQAALRVLVGIGSDPLGSAVATLGPIRQAERAADHQNFP
jgi:hypothetical protein